MEPAVAWLSIMNERKESGTKRSTTKARSGTAF
jgi:hypothetical protein